MNKKHYLVYAHTAKGFRSLLPTNLQSLQKLYVLQGGPARTRTDIMKSISSRPDLARTPQEFIHDPFDFDLLDGVLFPALGIGILDGTQSNVMEQVNPEIKVEYTNLTGCMETGKLSEAAEEIQELTDQIKVCCEHAYTAFAGGLKVHDEWEAIYIGQMDFKKADQLTETVCALLLGVAHFDKESSVKHRFFGGSTPVGPRDYVEELTRDISKRYFIKGRPGSGKSTMLKKIQKKAQDQGIDVEVYHCGFDPDSLDMLIFPELDLCIFDSTSPHEYFPSQESDSFLDLYEELIAPGTDEVFEDELAGITLRYRSFTKDGTAHLAEAKNYQDILEGMYLEAVDPVAINRLMDELYQDITGSNVPFSRS